MPKIKSILLSGILTRERLSRMSAELNRFSPFEKVVLVIESPGGDALEIVDFVNQVKNMHLDLLIKIYEASSAAAYVVIALDGYREMSRDAVLKLHRGKIQLDRDDMNSEGMVDRRIVERIRTYDQSLLQAMKMRNFNDTDRAILEVNNWLELSADECLRRGLVDELF